MGREGLAARPPAACINNAAFTVNVTAGIKGQDYESKDTCVSVTDLILCLCFSGKGAG